MFDYQRVFDGYTVYSWDLKLHKYGGPIKSASPYWMTYLDMSRNGVNLHPMYGYFQGGNEDQYGSTTRTKVHSLRHGPSSRMGYTSTPNR